MVLILGRTDGKGAMENFRVRSNGNDSMPEGTKPVPTLGVQNRWFGATNYVLYVS